jgi:tetratricopeptide (TPR) repeat protein
MASAKEKRAAIFDVFDNIIKERPMVNEQNLYAVNRIFSPYRYGQNKEARKYLKMSVYANQSNVTRSMVMDKRLTGGIHSVDEMLNLFTSVEFWGEQIRNGTGSIAVNYEKTLNTMVMDLYNDTVYYASEGGFSAWGAIYQIKISDMSIKVYRKELPQRKTKPIKDLLEWVDKYQMLSFQRDYEKIFATTDFNNDLTLRQLYYLYKSYQKEPQRERGVKLIDLADRLLKDYPDFGFLYKVKGEILNEIGEYQKAALTLEKSYNSRINYESEQLEVLLDLVRIYKQLKNVTKADYYIEQYCSLYDKMSKVSVPDEKFRIKYEEYRKTRVN